MINKKPDPDQSYTNAQCGTTPHGHGLTVTQYVTSSTLNIFVFVCFFAFFSEKIIDKTNLIAT